MCCLLLASHVGWTQQSAPQETPEQEIHRLAQAVVQAQAQLAASQQQLLQLQQSLAALEQRLAQEDRVKPASAAPLAAVEPAAPATEAPTVAADDDLHERQAMQESQIATLDQTKVESESKYPVKISGLILLNSFVNTSQVDIAAGPTEAVAGAGSTGATLRQTVLGIDARGPTLAGATSHADVRVDFFGSAASSTAGNAGQTNYADAGGLLRLRSAHATLDWSHTQAFMEFDRPILSPNVPTSLVAVAQPALAWSGNLWTWSSQVGFSHTLDIGASNRLSVAAALIDVPDPPSFSSTLAGAVSLAEHSRWPGTELHLGWAGRDEQASPSIGIGGYFSPHKTAGGNNFDAWAGTLDLRLPLPMGLELSGSFYRGSSLGGLGGGAYKDYVFYNGKVRALDDVGGWAQLKKRAGPRLEFNGALGLDNAFAGEIPAVTATTPTVYQGIARNQSYFANTIYSPKASLMFSLEVRHLMTVPAYGISANSNAIGIAAGYKF